MPALITPPNDIQALLAEINRDQGNGVEAAMNHSGYDSTRSGLLADDNDFIVLSSNRRHYLFVSDLDGWEVQDISEATYAWEESMVGDTEGFDLEAFQEELDHAAPGCFLRVEYASPGESHPRQEWGDFSDQLERIWRKTLDECCRVSI